MFLEDISGRSAVDFGLECTSKNFMYYVHSLRTNLQAACLVQTLYFTLIMYCIVDTKRLLFCLLLSSFSIVPGEAAG